MSHITITNDGYDYRVPAPDGREESAYYTDNKQDAIDTARGRFMYNCRDLKIRFRTVEEHPGA